MQEKLINMNMFILHFFYLCPLRLAIMLNSNTSKVAYSGADPGIFNWGAQWFRKDYCRDIFVANYFSLIA